MKNKSKSYNGHKNWNHWNVSLWINNDYGLYNFARELCRKLSKGEAAKVFVEQFKGEKTPDGALYSISAVRAAMSGM